MIKPLIALSLIAALAGCAPQHASTVSPVPPSAPSGQGLDLYTRLVLPPDIVTVGQATTWLLKPTGYRLDLTCLPCPAEAPRIAADPISPLALNPEVTTVRRAVLLVLGSDARLVVDHQHKIVSFAFFDKTTDVAL